jgi:chromosome segregation ATPase
MRLAKPGVSTHFEVALALMKSNVAIGLLAILGLALGIGWLMRHNQAERQYQTDQAHILQLSNDVVRTGERLQEQQGVNRQLETTLAARAVELLSVSNTLVETRSTLADTQARLSRTEADARAAAQKAAADLAQRDTKIAELEGQNDDLSKKLVDLNTALTNVEQQIKETERKLAASEGEREFLLKELKRLQAEKAELERQFNDLAVLREQVRRLKEELSVARRLEWIRQGLYGSQNQKGAERLMSGVRPTPARTNYNVEVELRQDGTIKIAPPLTNAPGTSP